MNESTSSDALPRAAFPVTRWSVVLAAKRPEQPESAQALETLCKTYWLPLYAFIRGSGRSPADAQDLTQEFFARLLEKNYLRVVEPEKGRFRTFLRVALKRFLAHEWERSHAAKRGGGGTQIPFDTTLAEERFAVERSDALSPDRLYDRQWAMALLEQAIERLTREYEASAKMAEFEQLKPFLTTERGAIPYATIAAALNTTEGAARVSLHRMRKRFREAFRQAIADTVATPEEAEAEMREVLEALRGS